MEWWGFARDITLLRHGERWKAVFPITKTRQVMSNNFVPRCPSLNWHMIIFKWQGILLSRSVSSACLWKCSLVKCCCNSRLVRWHSRVRVLDTTVKASSRFSLAGMNRPSTEESTTLTFKLILYFDRQATAHNSKEAFLHSASIPRRPLLELASFMSKDNTHIHAGAFHGKTRDTAAVHMACRLP